MNQEQSEQLTRIYFAIGAALILHILLLLALSYIPISPEEELRTVPTVTITTGSIASNASKANQTQSANAIAANEYLATLEASEFKVQQARTQQLKRRSNNSKPNQSNNNTLSETTKTSKERSNNQSQSSRAKKANQGMMNIFKQKKITGEVEQISTAEHKELSDYEISLRSILSRDVLYDKYHQFMAAKGNKNKNSTINFEVSIILFANGAIKKAEISRSSGIKEIDALAKQTAYSVSPYPRPPIEDSQKGFKYKIAITWVPYKK